MSRVAYISGAYDSLVTFVEGEQAGRNSRHYRKCVATAQMTNFQLAANVLNFAKDKPELHVGSVQGALIEYLNAACGPNKLHRLQVHGQATAYRSDNRADD